MKKRFLIALLVGVVGIVGCKDDEPVGNISIAEYVETNNVSGLTETTTGLFYKYEQEGTGDFLTFGDSARVLISGRFTDDTEFAEVQDRDSPITFVYAEGEWISGLEEGLAFLKTGSIVTLYLPSELAFGETGNGGAIGKNEDVIFTIEAIEVKARLTVKDYLLAKGITDYQETESGLIYIIDELGEGEFPTASQSVEVNYTGYHLDDVKFDSSYDRNEPFSFELGTGQVITGWDEGIALFKAGGKGTLYIPFDLAYGKTGIVNFIAPYEDLKFEIELISFE